jgi:type IV pilus assembly protein PilY1
MNAQTSFLPRRTCAGQALAIGLAMALFQGSLALATTPLADGPVLNSSRVPGNLALALSVEYPTAVSVAHLDSTYSSAKTYIGYFDPNKCYLYHYSATESQRHFYPAGAAASRTCTGTDDSKWSGNFLNWATMQTIDPFRWALTGGYRVVDTATETIIEKAWASGQGGTGNFPNRTVTANSAIAGATPFAWNNFRMRVQGLGNKMRFTDSGGVDNSPTAYDPGAATSSSTTHELSVRVKVCDSSATAGPLEANCTAFPAGNYKPTGLLQQYADEFRFSAFGYLNDGDLARDGGVLRARQKHVGPQRPVPGSTPVTNTAAEWSADNGVFVTNPDSADASATATAYGVTVNNSGVINYLNKFGQINPGNYKGYDPVGELYYAAIRYFKNLGNVPEWTNAGSANTATKTTWVDGFPVITSWDDPIQYSCQRNFVLGIGDVNTHADKNVPGSHTSLASEPARPSALALDPLDALIATNKVGQLQGLGSNLGTTYPYNTCCNNNSALMAGIAYDANTVDIRPDNPLVPRTVGKQTVQTYWLDVLEYQTWKPNNQFYLASKFGGARVPSTFSPYAQTTDLPQAWWSTNGETLTNGTVTQPRPDNYFVAAAADQMVSGLQKAFAAIQADMRAFTTSFATALPQVALTGTAAYGAQYDASSWTGDVLANSVVFDASTGDPTLTLQWSFNAKLATQLASGGWDTNRRMVSWNPATSLGVPFRLANLSTAQKDALDTIYRSGDDRADYLAYLRGDSTHEENSAASGSAKIYRNRTRSVGDIVGSKVRPVGPPAAGYSEANNPGYAAFKSTYANRTTMIYVGSNAGMLHAIDGSLSGATAGREVFAYVPSALFSGATAPGTDGLASRGDPEFTHRPLVDGPVAAFDMDFGKTQGGTGTDWRTVLVGGLGKGGRSYYAIDITNPATFTNETTTAGKVLWEFSHADLGFSFGEPAAVKTRKYGWVLIFASGYNNADGKGYFFIVNPRTGALLEKVATGAGSTSAQAGMAHVQAFVLDRTDGVADAAYAGDLLGNLWRLDLTGNPSSYPAPVQLAQLTNTSGQVLPVTSRPLVVVHPKTGRRFVTVGTGRLLDSSDVASTQSQVFAAIIDGNGYAFNTAAKLPSGITFPIQRSNLVQQTNLLAPLAINTSTHMGWWADMGTGATGQGWRVITEPSSFYGVVTWSSMLPGADPCSPGGTGRVYSVDVGTGESQLLDAADVQQPFTAWSNVVIEHRTYSVAGRPVLIVGDDAGNGRQVKRRNPAALGLMRLNWRELPLAD